MQKSNFLKLTLVCLLVTCFQSCDEKNENLPSPKTSVKEGNTAPVIPCIDWYSAATGEFLTSTGQCDNNGAVPQIYTGGGPGSGEPDLGGGSGDTPPTMEEIAPSIGDYSTVLTFNLDRTTDLAVIIDIDRSIQKIQKITLTAVGLAVGQRLVQLGDGSSQTAYRIRADLYSFQAFYQIVTGTTATGDIVYGPIIKMTGTVSPSTGVRTLIKTTP